MLKVLCTAKPPLPVEWLIPLILAIAGLAIPSLVCSAEALPGIHGPDYAASRLVGTMDGGPFSGAVFEAADGVQTFYRLGVDYLDGTKIVQVGPRSITVRTGDGSYLEYRVAGGTPGPPTQVRFPDHSDGRQQDTLSSGSSSRTGPLEGRPPRTRRAPPKPRHATPEGQQMPERNGGPWKGSADSLVPQRGEP